MRSDDGFVVAPGTFTPWGSWDCHDVFPGDVAECPVEVWDVIDHDTRTGTSSGSTGTTTRGLADVLARLVAAGQDQDADAVRVLCEHHGGHHPYRKADGTTHVTRPDKSAGPSATVGFVGPGIVKMFTSSWEPFTEGHRYIVNADGTSLVDENDELRFNPSGSVGPDAPPTGSDRFRRWSITELLAADLTYQWDAVGMLVRPTYGMDTGELKTLKSTFGLARLIGLAASVPILGHWPVPERRRVLVYVAEGGRIPFTRRLVRLCEAHGIEPADLDGWLEPIYDSAPLDSVVFRDALRRHLVDYRPAFVHLDPLYPFQPMTVDSNKVAQVGLMLTDAQTICAEHDATFWLTAHMNQSGQGFDLKRIVGAGVGEWGDSWTLMKHRETPDVDAGRFRLNLDVGSRQWGGASFDVDFNIGRFDPDTGTHDGPITFAVHAAGGAERSDGEAAKRLAARRAVFNAVRKARRPLSRTEIKERATGASKTYIVAEINVLVDEGQLVEHGIRKAESNGHETPLYRLAEGAEDA